MKKRIVLAGLNSIQNYGDHFIGECVEYLVGICKKETECVTLDLDVRKNNLRFLIYGGLRLLGDFIPSKNVSYKLTFEAMRIRFYRYYYNVLKSADALIFACGSFKYGTQSLWAQYSIAIECAEKLDIPIMFDAMNIQRYNADDWRCLCLQNHANRPCVKMISSRDGYAGVKRLKEDYIRNRDIQILPVGDPAFWIPERYKIKKNPGDKIGINLIREDIYKDYGWDNVSEAQMLESYSQLIVRLCENGISWELFTNGLPEDYAFGCKVLKNCGFDNAKDYIKIPKNAEDLVHIIAGYKGILGARLHACICAYSLDIPMAGFIWDEKILNFAEMAGVNEYFCEKGKFSGEELFVNLQKAINGTVESNVRENWKNRTQESIDYFLQLI